jgi:orotate phosphoribosyltransferase-like protein
MDGNQERESLSSVARRYDGDLVSLIRMCNRALQDITLPVSSAGQIEFCRRLDELSSALATVRTRLEVAAVLSRVPIATSGVGTSPMAAEAVDRLLLALINVVAHQDT